MNYDCLTNQNFKNGSYQLAPLRFEDIQLIKDWRNDQMDILRQDVVLTDEMQKTYFEEIIKPSFSLETPKQILFSFFKDSKFIGYGGIVHIDWPAGQGEVSFLVDTQRAKNPNLYEEDFKAYLLMIKEVAFHDLHFTRLYTETFDIRSQHIAILESAGFKEEKRLKNWVTINHQPIDALIHGYTYNVEE